MTLKKRSKSKVIINSSFCHNDATHKVKLESILRFKNIIQKPYFGQNLTFQSAGVTLKIRPRLLISNQFFPPSQKINYTSLVKIGVPVQKL